MKVKQLSIFLENQSGRLAEVTEAIGNEGINIRALSLADTSGFGILRLIVDDIDKARDILKARQFTVRETYVIAVEIPIGRVGWEAYSRSSATRRSTSSTCTHSFRRLQRTRSSSSASTMWTRRSRGSGPREWESSRQSRCTRCSHFLLKTSPDIIRAEDFEQEFTYNRLRGRNPAL